MYKMSKKKIILGLGIMFVLALTLVSFVAADDYCLLSMTKGQKIHVTSTSYYTCTHTTCSQICVYNNGQWQSWYAAYSNCQGNGIKVCSFNGIGGNSVPDNFTMTASFPFSDGAVLTKQTFNLNIHTNKIASIVLIDNNNHAQTSLCPNCNSYTRPYTFKQGFNNITIRAVYGNNILYRTISFFIDNQKPSVTGTNPVSNKYTSGVFNVTYNEDNVKDISIYYGLSTSTAVKQKLTGCKSGKAQTCSVDIGSNAAKFDGKAVLYWFVITDIANNVVNSRVVNKVFVDTTAPVIKSANVSTEKKGNYVNFKLNIVEKNLDKVLYFDNGDTKGKVLCPVLSNGMCSARLGFKVGNHNLTITAFDKAGNTASVVKSFKI